MINEADGSATVNIRLVNEVERDFTIAYSTSEVDDGAEGMKNIDGHLTCFTYSLQVTEILEEEAAV